MMDTEEHPIDDDFAEEVSADPSAFAADGFIDTADEEHIRREKAKAREMRHSQWWKNECGRGVWFPGLVHTARHIMGADHTRRRRADPRGGQSTKVGPVTGMKS